MTRNGACYADEVASGDTTTQRTLILADRAIVALSLNCFQIAFNCAIFLPQLELTQTHCLLSLEKLAALVVVSIVLAEPVWMECNDVCAPVAGLRPDDQFSVSFLFHH